jgi:putative transposase
MEDLNVKRMVRNHRLSDSILDMNFGEFRRILQYKSLWYNRKLVFIDRYYPSSKRCNHCGYINKSLKLNVRQWTCPDCGQIIDRDYNASLNILEEGQRIIGCSTAEFTLVDYPTMDDKEEIPLKSSGRLKQEVKSE